MSKQTWTEWRNRWVNLTNGVGDLIPEEVALRLWNMSQWVTYGDAPNRRLNLYVKPDLRRLFVIRDSVTADVLGSGAYTRFCDDTDHIIPMRTGYLINPRLPDFLRKRGYLIIDDPWDLPIGFNPAMRRLPWFDEWVSRYQESRKEVA